MFTHSSKKKSFQKIKNAKKVNEKNLFMMNDYIMIENRNVGMNIQKKMK